MVKNLNFMKCIFFTYQQYNVDKIHIPKETLVYELNIINKSDNEISEIINKFIDYVYNKLNEGNKTGIPIKIPMPIFILMGRKLEEDRNIFENEKINIEDDYNFGKDNKIKRGNLAIIDFFKSFFNSGINNSEVEKEKYKNSLITTYKFKGNKKIILYFPYITNEYKYITNFLDVSNSLRFFFTLISKDNFLNFQRTTTIDYNKLKNELKIPPYTEKSIKKIIEILKREEKNKYSYYDDLYLLCKEGGCISDDGEDFFSLIPEYTEYENKNNENAIKYSPFLPNKCIAQTNGYIKNIKNATKQNIDIIDFIKKEALDEMKEKLKIYIKESNKLIKTAETELKDNEISNYKSPVDLIINIINNKIKDKYSTNLNDGGKTNYYSREYSQNIIKELSYLKKIYPGIPEIVMSLYLYDEQQNKDKIIYMPWGKTLISKRNVISIGEILEINKKLYSFNNNYALIVLSNGLIFVIENKTGNIIYFINRKSINNTKGITFELNGFIIEYIDNLGNYKSQNIINEIDKLIDDCNECKNPPYSLLLDNENGNIKIYSNSFYDATNKKINKFIEKEKEILMITRKNNIDNDIYNINNPKFIEQNNIKIDLIQEEDYIFCADIDKECKK